MKLQPPKQANQYSNTNSIIESQFLNIQPDQLPDAVYLTPDALMSYCTARLQGIDSQVNEAFAKQQLANADSQVLSALQDKLTVPTKDIDLTSQGGVDCAKASADAMMQAAQSMHDPQAKQALIDNATAIYNRISAHQNNEQGASSTIDVATFKQLTSDAVGGIQKDLNSGTELSMIKLQSLMSQRQSAIQMCTNLIQSLGDQMNKIAQNIGH